MTRTKEIIAAIDLHLVYDGTSWLVNKNNRNCLVPVRLVEQWSMRKTTHGKCCFYTHVFHHKIRCDLVFASLDDSRQHLTWMCDRSPFPFEKPSNCSNVLYLTSTPHVLTRDFCVWVSVRSEKKSLFIAHFTWSDGRSWKDKFQQQKK